MTNLVGRRIGRYEIRAELGRGGMARVYRAVDTLLQRQVALKILAAQLSLDAEFVRRFEREATTVANLRHPGIVTVYDVGDQDGLYYIAMEFINGRTLHTVLNEQAALGLGYAISILDPIARALDFAHSQDAVHRDVKPHNIMIDSSGRVLLTDFGIAQTSNADDERLTRTGVFMGTPEYISPEQAEARRVDGRSDLYSLGVVAYEIITGRVPFSGATPQLIVAHAQIPPPPPTSVAAHLPSDLDSVLAKALAKRPERRYPSGQALVDALRQIAQRYGIPLATREQLAALVSVDGEDALLPPNGPQLPPPPARQEPVQVPPAIPATAPTRPRPPISGPNRVEPAAPTNGTSSTTGPRTATGQARNSSRPNTRQTYRQNQRRGANQWPVLIIGIVLVGLTVLLLVVVSRGFAIGGPPTARSTATPSHTQQSAPPTETPTEEPSSTPSELSTIEPTPEPTEEPTNAPPTSAPPTRAPQPTVAPTEAPTLEPTLTLAPADTATPTPTEIPLATDTPAPTETPTNTITPTPTEIEEPPLLPSAEVQTPVVP